MEPTSVFQSPFKEIFLRLSPKAQKAVMTAITSIASIKLNPALYTALHTSKFVKLRGLPLTDPQRRCCAIRSMLR